MVKSVIPFGFLNTAVAAPPPPPPPYFYTIGGNEATNQHAINSDRMNQTNDTFSVFSMSWRTSGPTLGSSSSSTHGYYTTNSQYVYNNLNWLGNPPNNFARLEFATETKILLSTSATNNTPNGHGFGVTTNFGYIASRQYDLNYNSSNTIFAVINHTNSTVANAFLTPSIVNGYCGRYGYTSNTSNVKDIYSNSPTASPVGLKYVVNNGSISQAANYTRASELSGNASGTSSVNTPTYALRKLVTEKFTSMSQLTFSTSTETIANFGDPLSGMQNTAYNPSFGYSFKAATTANAAHKWNYSTGTNFVSTGTSTSFNYTGVSTIQNSTRQ